MLPFQPPGFQIPAVPVAPAPEATADDASLAAGISAGSVLLLSGVPATASATVVRDALVPFGAVSDVALLLDSASGQPLGQAFALFDEPAEAQRVLTRCSAQSFHVTDVPVSVALAGLTHLNLAAHSLKVTWLGESSEHARERLSTAVKAAAAQQVNRGKGTHTLWNERVSEQAAIYAPALAAAGTAATALAPPRPVGLAASFQFDPASGQWLDPVSGYYFESHSQLYFHAGAGFSRWDAARASYVPVDPAEAAAIRAGGMPVDPAADVAAQYLALKAAQAIEQQQKQQQQQAAAGTSAAKQPISFSLAPSTRTGLAAAAPAFGASAAALVPPVAAAPAVMSSGAAAAPASFLDLPRLACLLCNRQLKTLEQLLKHEQLSELHKNNLAAWRAAHPGVEPPPPASANGVLIPQATATPPVTAASAASSAPAADSARSASGAGPAAASVPLSAAEEYLRAMAKHRALDHDESKRPMLK